MAINTKVWKLNGTETEELNDKGFDLESHLEEVIFYNSRLISEDWLLIGRQVSTGFGFIDLLAIDRNGDLVLLELKKDRTPREVIAQALDYGSWVKDIDDAKIAEIFHKYQEKYIFDKEPTSLDIYFEENFNMSLPDPINTSHSLVVVAASMDDSSERIVNYLEEYYQVNINFVLLRTFQSGSKKFITRTWFQEPNTQVEKIKSKKQGSWNSEYYVSFGENNHRNWADAVKYGFISGGGGPWYSQTLNMLSTGDRIWVNIPKVGYVGVGEVVRESVPAIEAKVVSNGELVDLKNLSLKADMFYNSNEKENCEYVVGVKWIQTVTTSQAIKEVGLFGNQNTVCKPTTDKWDHTIDRLKNLLLNKKRAA